MGINTRNISVSHGVRRHRGADGAGETRARRGRGTAQARHVLLRLVLNYSYSRLKKRATRLFFTEKGSARSIFPKRRLWLRQFVLDCAARMNGSGDGGMRPELPRAY